jgi:hypothetical protein
MEPMGRAFMVGDGMLICKYQPVMDKLTNAHYG